MHIMIIKNIIILIRKYLNFCMFDWSGKNGDTSGKVREKSGNLDILCEWQHCLKPLSNWMRKLL